MRELPAAVLVSVAVHAAALAWLVPGEPEPPIRAEVPPEPAPPEPAPPIDPPPIEIVLFDERIAAAELPPPPPGAAAGAAAAAISTGGASRTEAASSAGPGAATGTEPAGRNPLMTMRGPERAPARGLSSSFIDHFLARSKPAEPIPDLPGARLDAEIADLRARLRNPNRWDKEADRVRLVALTEERRRVELKPDGNGTYKADSPGFTAKIDRDGKAHLKNRPGVRFKGPLLIVEVTDMAMRAAGIDPYASEKLRFLDRTRDQRAAIAREHQGEQLAQSAHFMRRNIDRLWASTTDPGKRRLGLFELWDECAEDGDGAALAAGGADARKVVVDFVKVKLTGASAYTEGELARLNASRRSKAPFAPYE